MNTTNKILTVEHLSKTYNTLSGETIALKDINFEVDEGDFITIIGPSGCGKSTILNILANLEKDYKGKVNFDSKCEIGYMFQEHCLFDWLTVEENALLGLIIKKELTKENINYVYNLLKKYDLYDFKNSYPSNLSGGMKQRLALIRTLACKPRILLLDEPFSALDYQSRLSVGEDVYNIIKEEHKTVIMVSHDIAESIAMSNKIIVLSKRPSTIKNIHNINLSNKKGPIENRKAKEFSYYYDILWKEIDKNV